MKAKFIGALATTALLGGIALGAGEVFAETSDVTVGYTTKVEVSDPENPDSPSYALQLPAGFQFTQENEPLPGASEGTGIAGVFKLVNPTDNTTYTGTKAVKLRVSSANTWKLKTADSAAVLGADYTLKDGTTDATDGAYSFNLNKTISEKTLTAYLKGKAAKSGNYSDVLTFTYENVMPQP